MNVLEKLKSKIEVVQKTVQEQLDKHDDTSKVLSGNIEKLSQDKVNTHAAINALNGYLQAFKDVATIIENTDPTEAVEGLVEAAADVIAEK